MAPSHRQVPVPQVSLLSLNGDETLRAVSEPWCGRVKYVSAKAKDSLGLTALSARPDGFVARATGAEPKLTEAAEAMSRWLGTPAPVS